MTPVRPFTIYHLLFTRFLHLSQPFLDLCAFVRRQFLITEAHTIISVCDPERICHSGRGGKLQRGFPGRALETARGKRLYHALVEFDG